MEINFSISLHEGNDFSNNKFAVAVMLLELPSVMIGHKECELSLTSSQPSFSLPQVSVFVLHCATEENCWYRRPNSQVFESRNGDQWQNSLMPNNFSADSIQRAPRSFSPRCHRLIQPLLSEFCSLAMPSMCAHLQIGWQGGLHRAHCRSVSHTFLSVRTAEMRELLLQKAWTKCIAQLRPYRSLTFKFLKWNVDWLA